MSIVLTKLKGTYPIGELVKLHLKKVNCKFTIDITELVLPAILLRQIFRELGKIVSVVRAAVVYTFMDNKVFAIFNRAQSMRTIRSKQMKLRNILIVIMESVMANFALILIFTAVVVVYVLMWSTAKRTNDEIGNKPAVTAINRF